MHLKKEIPFVTVGVNAFHCFYFFEDLILNFSRSDCLDTTVTKTPKYYWMSVKAEHPAVKTVFLRT